MFNVECAPFPSRAARAGVVKIDLQLNFHGSFDRFRVTGMAPPLRGWYPERQESVTQVMHEAAAYNIWRTNLLKVALRWIELGRKN